MAFCLLLIDFTRIELINVHAQLTHIRCILFMANSLHVINKGMQPISKSVQDNIKAFSLRVLFQVHSPINIYMVSLSWSKLRYFVLMFKDANTNLVFGNYPRI